MTDDSAYALEAAIGRAIRGESEGADIPDLLLEATLVVPSGSAVGPRFVGFQPVLYERDGTPVLGVFTSLEKASLVATLAPYAVTLTGIELLAIMPPDHGLVVNPGHAEGFDMPPSGVARLRTR